MEIYYIGVDGGGSKTHALLLNQEFKIIAESFSLSANIRTNLDLAYTSITTAIDELVNSYQLNCAQIRIGVGIAGYSVATNLAILKERLEAKYPIVKLESDCHIACLAAHQGNDGAIVICGTGIVSYIISNGISKQIGGWGFPHGDLGGAAWIGLEICKLLCKAVDQIIPYSPLLKAVYSKFNQDTIQYKSWLLKATPAEFAIVARLIPDFIATDEDAQLIFKNGLDEIRHYIALMQKTKLPLKLVGGLSPFYLKHLQEEYKGLSLSTIAPAVGAIYLVK